MSAWISMLRGALLFDTATFEGLRERRDAMLRGALLIVAVALLAGLPSFLINLANGLQSHPMTDAEAAQAASGFDQWLNQMGPYMQNIPPEILNYMRQGMEAGVEIGRKIGALPTVLPRPVGGALQALGGWLSRPFAGTLLPLTVASLATWLGYGVWVMLAARLLGGRGDLRAFLGMTALFAGPHLLNVFSLVPFLGAVIGVVAFLWGLGIYVKATAISQDISTGRAALAVVLPALVVVALVLLGFLVLLVLILANAGR